MEDRPDPNAEVTGERKDFAEVYDEHVWSVYGFFGYRLGSRQEAEDLTQSTFEKALRAWDSYDERRGTIVTWLMAIARNTLIDHQRRDRSSRHESLDAHGDGEAMVGHTPAEEPLGVSPDLEAALSRLGERERELIALRFGGDLTGRQIAQLMGLSVANVQQILSRVLRQLRQELERSAADQPADVEGPPGR